MRFFYRISLFFVFGVIHYAPIIAQTSTVANEDWSYNTATFSWMVVEDSSRCLAPYEWQVHAKDGTEIFWGKNEMDLLSTTVSSSIGNIFFCLVRTIDHAGKIGPWFDKSEKVDVLYENPIPTFGLLRQVFDNAGPTMVAENGMTLSNSIGQDVGNLNVAGNGMLMLSGFQPFFDSIRSGTEKFWSLYE